jgi:hypothetical protein
MHIWIRIARVVGGVAVWVITDRSLGSCRCNAAYDRRHCIAVLARDVGVGGGLVFEGLRCLVSSRLLGLPLSDGRHCGVPKCREPLGENWTLLDVLGVEVVGRGGRWGRGKVEGK